MCSTATRDDIEWKLISFKYISLKDIRVVRGNYEPQNCFKAAIAFVCTSSKRQLLFAHLITFYALFYALLQLLTFVCIIAIDSNFCGILKMKSIY